VIVETLRVVPDPPPVERPVIRRDDADRVGPLFFSSGQVNLLCGACTFLLIQGARAVDAIFDAIVVCPNCGANNEAWDNRAARAGNEAWDDRAASA
jgi:hypothetical protein